MEKKPIRGLHPAWGFVAAGFYFAHGITLVRTGQAPHLVWSCHLACLVLAAGILLRRPGLAGIALMWLAIGLPTWITSALSRSDFFHPTSTLTHILGLGLAAWTVKVSGMPRGTWWRAAAGLGALWIVTRHFVPATDNVNVTRDFWFGWEAEFVPFPVYVGLLWLISAAVFYGIQRLTGADPEGT